MATRRASSLGLLALVTLPGCVSMAPRPRAPGPEARVVPGVAVRRFEDDRCGPGSLALVLNAHGDGVSERDLAAGLPDVSGRGVLSVDLLLAARHRGFDAALVEGNPERLRGEIESERPVILMLRLLDAPGRRRDIYHYVVIDDAAALYRQVLEVRPGSVRAWVDLGNAEATRRRADEAEDALNNLAWLLLEEGTRLEEAEALAAKAVSQPRPSGCPSRLGPGCARGLSAPGRAATRPVADPRPASGLPPLQ